MIYFETNYVGEVHDLRHPRVLWNSATRRGTLAVSSEATGFAGVNSMTATEADEWKPTAMPATWTLTMTAETISAVGINQHNIGTSGATVTVQEWDGLAWVDIIAATPSDDAPIAFLFKARLVDRIRLSFTGDTAPTVGVVYACEALEIPQKVYMGAPTPVDLARNTTYDSTMSTGGRYMGRSIKYAKNKNDFSVEHLTEYYVRNTLDPFIQDARVYPYFLLERPIKYPTALSYRWMDEDITPQRMGIRDFMSVNL